MIVPIVQNGHHFFGSAGNDELKEPKSFLAHLRENIETNLYTTTTTILPPRIVAPLMADEKVVPMAEEPDNRYKIFGDKKVSTFYLHMSIAISTFIVLLFIGISAYICYKRREFQSMAHTQPETPRRRSSSQARRKSSQFSNERQPINLR